jgi:hypothetical protein
MGQAVFPPNTAPSLHINGIVKQWKTQIRTATYSVDLTEEKLQQYLITSQCGNYAAVRLGASLGHTLHTSVGEVADASRRPVTSQFLGPPQTVHLRPHLHWTQICPGPIRHGCLIRYLPAGVPTLTTDPVRQLGATRYQWLNAKTPTHRRGKCN